MTKVTSGTQATSSQMKEIASINLEAVNKVEDPPRGKGKSWQTRSNDWNGKSPDDKPPMDVKKTCHFCGNRHEMNKTKCPVWRKQ